MFFGFFLPASQWTVLHAPHFRGKWSPFQIYQQQAEKRSGHIEDRVFWTTSKTTHHASPNGWLANDKALPSYCKKRDGAKNQLFHSFLKRRFKHPGTILSVPSLYQFWLSSRQQQIDGRNEHSAFCYSRLVILYFQGQNSAKAPRLGSFI